MWYMFKKIIKRTLISIFLSVKGTVENVDGFVVRVRAVKVGFASVHIERGNNNIIFK